MLFTVLFENVQALNARSERCSLFNRSFFANPLLLWSIVLALLMQLGAMSIRPLQKVLELSPIHFEHWLLLLVGALVLLLAMELDKGWLRRPRGSWSRPSQSLPEQYR